MNLQLITEAPPLNADGSGGLRVGGTRVLLEIVIRAFQDAATAETIVQRYPSLALSDVYSTIGYYLRHVTEVDAYLVDREQQAATVQTRVTATQPQTQAIRDRLLAQRK
jgi:uncharacterized protein (DUF433 family)